MVRRSRVDSADACEWPTVPLECDGHGVGFEAMDVFALSSLREGLPNVLLEAMALGVPVVATRVNGVPRLVQDGRNGLLVDGGGYGGG